MLEAPERTYKETENVHISTPMVHKYDQTAKTFIYQQTQRHNRKRRHSCGNCLKEKETDRPCTHLVS